MEFQGFQLCTVGGMVDHHNSMMADVSYHFNFCQMVQEEDNNLPQMINVSGVGDIALPVSLNDSLRMIESAVHSPVGKGLHEVVDPLYRSSRQIDAGLIKVSCPQNFLYSWIKLALQQPEIDADAIGTEAHLKEMLIYQSEGHYIRHNVLAQESGHFATMILQIPVENGYKGGDIVIEHHRKIQQFDLSRNSSSNFYVTVVHTTSQLKIAPVLSGCRIELIFHLTWKIPKVAVYPPLPDISSFLVSLTKIKKELRCWIEQPDNDQPPKMLVIGLKNNYDPDCHSFSSLLGQDRSVAYLMHSACVLEVSLARLTRKVTGSPQPVFTEFEKDDSRRPNKTDEMNEIQKTELSVSHWIGVDNVAVQLQELNMDTQSQFVGSVFKPEVKPDRKEIIEDAETKNTTLTYWYHQSVLIIWPKSKALYFDLRHRFDYLLDQMERGEISESTKMMKNVVSKSSEWTKTEQRICRLLNLCLHFNTKEEALQLLQLLVDYSMGIPSNDAAWLIAELLCKLIEWESCKELIEKLVMCKPMEQICFFATLSEALLDRRASSEFDWVSNAIRKIFLTPLKPSPVFNLFGLVACASVFVRMDEQAEGSRLELSNAFIFYFAHQLTVLQQCHIVIDLQEICRQSDFGKLFLLCLCSHIVVKVDPFDKSLDDCLVELVLCFSMLDPHEPNVLDCFTKKICESAGSHLLQKLSSIEMLNLPNDILQRILDTRISELQSLTLPTLTWEQKEARFQGSSEYPEVQTFLQSREKTMTIKSRFVNLQDARNFVKTYFSKMHVCVEQGFSVEASLLGSGKKTKCIIVKTLNLYSLQLEKFEESRQELKYLLQRRANLLGLQPSDALEFTPSSSLHVEPSNSINQIAKISNKRKITEL